MDSLMAAAAHALATGDPLLALKCVSLRDDPPALALRGIAMAQIGDLPRARLALRRAARAFGQRNPVAKARCVVAEAEIALVSRDLAAVPTMLDAARTLLEKQGDRINAAHAAILEVRRLLLVGQIHEAERLLLDIDIAALPPSLRATYHLAECGIALRRLRARVAREALARAETEARKAGISALLAEVRNMRLSMTRSAALLISGGRKQLLSFAEVEDLLASDTLVVDACRYVLRNQGTVLPLTTRPVLFSLARSLAERWPDDVPRGELIASAFGSRYSDESHRARLRVEMARLRAELGGVATINATANGFVIQARQATRVAVLAPPKEERHATVLALLADGESWPSSALALALNVSARTVQRALDELKAREKCAQSARAARAAG